MINSVADYIMLDMTGKRRYVTGNILPVREGGAKRALKYEDLLFLKEGKLERQNWNWPNGRAPEKVQPPGRFVRRAAFKDAVCSGTWNAFRDKDKSITEGMTAIGQIESVVGSVVALGSFDAGRTLKLEKLEKAYENMEKLKRTMQSESGLTINEIKRRSKKINTNTGEITTYPDEIYTGDVCIYESAVAYIGYPSYGMETHTCQGRCTLVEKQFPYAVKAWLIANATTTTETGGGEDWVVMECEVTKGQNAQMATVRLEKNLDEIARIALERHGGNYVVEPNFSMGNQSVRFYKDYLLVEHDFPATAPVAEE